MILSCACQYVIVTFEVVKWRLRSSSVTKCHVKSCGKGSKYALNSQILHVYINC